MQFVLRVQRDHLLHLLDESHRRRDREGRGERAGPKLRIDRVAAGRCIDRRLRQLPLGVLELRADLCDRRVLVAEPAREALAQLPLASARLHLTGARLRQRATRGVELRLEVPDVALGLFEREAIARARGNELAVLADTLSRDRA